MADALQNRDNRASFFRQGVFHPGRDLVIGPALDHIVCQELLQRRRQDSVCDIAHLLAQRAVAQCPLPRQDAEDTGFPLAAEQRHTIFQRAADILFQLWLIQENHLLILQILILL